MQHIESVFLSIREEQRSVFRIRHALVYTGALEWSAVLAHTYYLSRIDAENRGAERVLDYRGV
jgi:hypothetical protein